MSTMTRRPAPWTKTRSRPRGIILIVVLALLTLFALVGMTFVFYSDTAHPILRPFRDDTFQLAQQTLDLAQILAPDLARSRREPVDFSASLAAIDGLAESAAQLKARIRAAHDSNPDPDAQESLAALCHRLEGLQRQIDLLRSLIEELQRG